MDNQNFYSRPDRLFSDPLDLQGDFLADEIGLQNMAQFKRKPSIAGLGMQRQPSLPMVDHLQPKDDSLENRYESMTGLTTMHGQSAQPPISNMPQFGYPTDAFDQMPLPQGLTQSMNFNAPQFDSAAQRRLPMPSNFTNRSPGQMAHPISNPEQVYGQNIGGTPNFEFQPGQQTNPMDAQMIKQQEDLVFNNQYDLNNEIQIGGNQAANQNNNANSFRRYTGAQMNQNFQQQQMSQMAQHSAPSNQMMGEQDYSGMQQPRYAASQFNIANDPIASGYRKYETQSQQNPFMQQAPIIPDFFVQGQQDKFGNNDNGRSNPHELALRKLGQQIFQDYQQIKNLNVKEKVALETNQFMATMDKNYAQMDLEDLRMRTYSCDVTSMNSAPAAQTDAQSERGGTRPYKRRAPDSIAKARMSRQQREMSHDITQGKSPLSYSHSKAQDKRTRYSSLSKQAKKVNSSSSNHSMSRSVSSFSSKSNRSKGIKKDRRGQQPFPKPIKSKGPRKSTFYAQANDQQEDMQSDQTWSDENSHTNQNQNSNPMQDEGESVRYIGPISEKHRLEKVRKYLRKKHNKANTQKYCYTCRQQVAEKRLRIKGRFVTKEQAFEILGLTQDQLLDNIRIQELLTQHASQPLQVNSLIEDKTKEGQMIKVRNFQALIDNNYKHTQKGSDSTSQVPTEGMVIEHITLTQKDGIRSDRQEPNFDMNTPLLSPMTEGRKEMLISQTTKAQNESVTIAKPFAQHNLLTEITTQAGPRQSPVAEEQLLVISNHSNGNDSASSNDRRLRVDRSDVQPLFKVEKVSSGSNGSMRNNNSNENSGSLEDDQMKNSGTPISH